MEMKAFSILEIQWRQISNILIFTEANRSLLTVARLTQGRQLCCSGVRWITLQLSPELKMHSVAREVQHSVLYPAVLCFSQQRACVTAHRCFLFVFLADIIWMPNSGTDHCSPVSPHGPEASFFWCISEKPSVVISRGVESKWQNLRGGYRGNQKRSCCMCSLPWGCSKAGVDKNWTWPLMTPHNFPTWNPMCLLGPSWGGFQLSLRGYQNKQGLMEEDGRDNPTWISPGSLLCLEVLGFLHGEKKPKNNFYDFMIKEITNMLLRVRLFNMTSRSDL